MDGLLAKQKFIAGKTFSVADAYAFTVISWCKHVGIDLSVYKHITTYLATVAKRPAVQAAMKAEGLLG